MQGAPGRQRGAMNVVAPFTPPLLGITPTCPLSRRRRRGCKRQRRLSGHKQQQPSIFLGMVFAVLILVIGLVSARPLVRHIRSMTGRSLRYGGALLVFYLRYSYTKYGGCDLSLWSLIDGFGDYARLLFGNMLAEDLMTLVETSERREDIPATILCTYHTLSIFSSTISSFVFFSLRIWQGIAQAWHRDWTSRHCRLLFRWVWSMSYDGTRI